MCELRERPRRARIPDRGAENREEGVEGRAATGSGEEALTRAEMERG